MKEKKKFDLGSKNVKKTFLSILVPTLVAQVISGTFVIFDTFFVSHSFHPGALGDGIGTGFIATNSAYAALGPAAMSYAIPYTFFIVGAGLAIGAGLAAIMTKQLAKKDKVGVQNSMNSYLPLTIIIGAVLMIFILIFAKVLVWFGSGFQKEYLDSWFNNPSLNSNWNMDLIPKTQKDYQEIYSFVNGHLLQQASLFLRIQAIGAIPYVYMAGAVIMLRVQGKAQHATAISTIGLVTNIILDFLFIMVLKLNVVGAAIATVIGQLATAIVYQLYFKFKADIKTTSLNWSFAKENISKVLKAGTSIMMLQVLTGILLIMFTFSIGISNYGIMSNITNVTSVYQGYNAIFIFLNLVIIGIAQSMKPIVGYNYQTGDVENLKKARNYGIISSLVFSIICMILMMLFTKDIIGLFYGVNGTSVDYITSGYYGSQGGLPLGDAIAIKTDGTQIAINIVKILFLTFPIAVMISVCGTYLQAIEEDRKSSFLLFGKVFLVGILLLIFAFIKPLSELFKGDWEYVFINASNHEINPSTSINTSVNLGMFMVLPIVDAISAIVLVVFLILTEKNVIKKIQTT